MTHHLAIIAWREGARRHSSKDFNLELVTPSVAQPGEIWKIPASIDKKSNLYCNGRPLLIEKYFIYQNKAMQLLWRMISVQARCYTYFIKTRKMGWPLFNPEKVVSTWLKLRGSPTRVARQASADATTDEPKLKITPRYRWLSSLNLPIYQPINQLTSTHIHRLRNAM